MKGLIIVGDIGLANSKQAKAYRKGKGMGKGELDFRRKLEYKQDGKPQRVQAETLRKIYWWFQSKERKIEMAVPIEGGKQTRVQGGLG